MMAPPRRGRNLAFRGDGRHFRPTNPRRPVLAAANTMFYSYAQRLEQAEALALNLRIDAQPSLISAATLEVLASMPYGLQQSSNLVYTLFTLDVLPSRMQHGQPNYALQGRHGAGLTQRVLRFLRRSPGLTASQLVALAERFYLHCQHRGVATRAC